MFFQSTSNNGNSTPTSHFNSLPENQAAQAYPSSPHATLYFNGSIPNSGVYEQLAYQGISINNANTAWNGQVVPGMNLQQQPLNGRSAYFDTYTACGTYFYSIFLSIIFHDNLFMFVF